MADVLIHAGDLTNNGTVEEIQKQIDWLASLPHREKIVIAGNHDSYFDPKSRFHKIRARNLNLRTLHYLENKAITLKFKGGRKLNSMALLLFRSVEGLTLREFSALYLIQALTLLQVPV